MNLDNYETTRSPYCGRLDKHPAHEWLGRDNQPAVARIVRECPGAPDIEGGQPGVSSCDECGWNVNDDDAAPSCGAHRLHDACSPYFSCRQCRNERKGINR